MFAAALAVWQESFLGIVPATTDSKHLYFFCLKISKNGRNQIRIDGRLSFGEQRTMQQLFHPLVNSYKYLWNLRRWLLGIVTCLAAMQLVVFPAAATGTYDFPNLSNVEENTWIFDKADVLSPLNKQKLQKQLSETAEDTGTQIRLVTLRGLDYGETVTSFTDNLFEKWFSNPEEGKNQVLLVLDTLSNNTAIHTGEQVKSILSDDIAESVASETMMVPIRDGNKYNQAFLDATSRLATVLSGEPDPGAPQLEKDVQVAGTFTPAEETDVENSTWLVIGLLVAATIIPMATYFLYVR